MKKGICSLSGGIKTSGINATNQITRPMKSLVARWEPLAKKFFMCAKPINWCLLVTSLAGHRIYQYKGIRLTRNDGPPENTSCLSTPGYSQSKEIYDEYIGMGWGEWTNQYACRPKKMKATNDRRITGTVSASNHQQTKKKKKKKPEKYNLGWPTVRASHTPRESRGNSKPDMMLLTHPATSHSQKTRNNTTDSL